MKFRYSSPVSRSYISWLSGTKPIRRFAASGFATISCPPMITLPSVGARMPVRSLMVVVFPAPLGPIKPNTLPFSTCSVRSSRALTFPFPYCLLTCSNRIIGNTSFFRCHYSKGSIPAQCGMCKILSSRSELSKITSKADVTLCPLPHPGHMRKKGGYAPTGAQPPLEFSPGDYTGMVLSALSSIPLSIFICCA